MNFQLPELGEGVYEAEMSRWLVKPGDAVKPGQGLLEVLTDKATMEVPAPFAGTIDSVEVREGQNIKVGQVVLRYSGMGAEAASQTPMQKETTTMAEPAPPVAFLALTGNGASAKTPILKQTGVGDSPPVKAAPSVRLMARKLGIDIASLRGSGPDGRILVEDLTSQIPAGQASAKRQAVPATDYGTPGTKAKLHGLRRKIAEHMVHAKQTIPHYSYVDECDVTELVKLREALKEPFAKKGVKITYLAFVARAVALALREMPIVNASLDDEAGEIVLHEKINIGIAVAAPGGLIVPVVLSADQLDLLDLAREIERLSSEAKTGKAKREDLRDGTFTVTSIGNIGGLISTPIINHPEVGILGVGKIVRRPVFDDHGQMKPADMVYLSFSFDHRVLDGAVGAAFGNAVMKRLANPIGLLVE